MEVDLPFTVEYAKTGRASCKGCKMAIGKDKLRLGVLVQSAFHDGKVTNWFHENCFFKKQRPGSEGDIANLECLKSTDIQRIREKISELGSGVVLPQTGKGKKRKNEENGVAKDFGVEYSKSSRAKCRGCEQIITKGEVRIKKILYDTEIGMKFGGEAIWHHMECFAQIRKDLGWYDKGENIPGYETLSAEDQEKLKELIKIIEGNDLPFKKVKEEIKAEFENSEEKKLNNTIDKQSKKLFKIRDKIKKEMKRNDIIELYEINNQVKPSDSGKVLDHLADILTFGVPKPCPKCKNGQFLFSKSGYLCIGDLSEWVKCQNLLKEPPRVPCKISDDLKQKYSFLNDIKPKVEKRAIKYVPPSINVLAKQVKKEDELDGPKVKREKPPLYKLEFCIVGLKENQKSLKERILRMGGKVVTSVHEKLAAIISTPNEIERMTLKMRNAKDYGIQVVPEDFLEAVKGNNNMEAISYITSKSICDWGTDPYARIQQVEEKSKSKSIYTKYAPKSVKLKVKGGTAVDPESGLEDKAHVYTDGSNKYSVVLGLTDIQRNKNSFYKIQLLEDDKKNRFWIFRSWGRIGTTIGDKRVVKYSTLDEARNEFKRLYLEKTDNDFDYRDNFVKVQGKMYPIDIEYSDDELKMASFNDSKIPSKLSQAVQDLIKLVFDINAMKKAMIEFELDMEKMPLGKLSKKQIQTAYKVLKELSELIKSGNTEDLKFIEGTNQFYTLIPHNFGIAKPPIINTYELIQKNSDVLDSLLEIECAYSMLSNDEDNKDDVNPIDQQYEKLKTDIMVISHESEEFKLLEKYVQNTHAETHRMYDLQIIDIFKISRKGESRRYKPFKKLNNRKLLWHGSRLTNYAGIISHGLKIAPPEAPVTGYMFGKGIYFADMVSKSANYCFTSKQNSTGLVILSEVALGDIKECTQAEYIEKLPKNKHSVKGVGKTQPDPTESHYREDGVEIPLGKPVTNENLKSSLLYNEYIVYDVAQVNIQYLLRMNFQYK